MATLPYPPLALANRVGSLEAATDPWAYYDTLGEHARRDIEAILPDDWSWAGKRVLDFGAGAGRTLRRFLDLEDTDIHGCDIDAESIAWLNAHLSPPVTAFVNGEHPPLPRPDDDFDLIYVISVFTHLSSTWGEWLLELRRVLADDGLLVVTFMGEGCSEWILGEPWNDDETGMLVVSDHAPWDEGGPMVLHSPWWIREHWGRAFEILEITPLGFAMPEGPASGAGQGTVLMRKNDREVTVSELEALAPHEPREAPALARNLGLVQQEVARLRQALTAVEAERDAAVTIRDAYDVLVHSRSWRFTKPLREGAQRARRSLGRDG